MQQSRYEAFFNLNGYNKKVAAELLYYSKKEFTEHMIEEYIISMKKNSESNDNRFKNIKRGQYCYLGGISAIIVILFFIIIMIIFNVPIILPNK